MRANVSGCSKRRGPRGSASGVGRLPVGDAGGRAAEHVAHLLLREPGDERGAQREEEGARLLAVGVVRRVQHLAGRDAREHVQEVDRAPDRGVEVDPGRPAKQSERAARSAIPAWAMMSEESG